MKIRHTIQLEKNYFKIYDSVSQFPKSIVEGTASRINSGWFVELDMLSGMAKLYEQLK